jgi:hypothetical protein
MKRGFWRRDVRRHHQSFKGITSPTFPSIADAVVAQSDYHDSEFGTIVCSKGNSSEFIFSECT